LHQRQYEQLQKRFGSVRFQSEDNFKAQVLNALSQFDYVLFLVDDNIFIRNFSLVNVTSALRSNNDAIGFSLRLGINTNYCYPKDVSQKLPEFELAGNNVLKYDWTKAEYDFGYPLEICSSVYRTADILPILKAQKYNSPNTLEGMMACNAYLYKQDKSKLLCCESSVAFTNPINIVQKVTSNRAGDNDKYSSEKLAEMFESGSKIDVKRFSGFVPASCHQEVSLSLCDKNEISSSI